MNLKIRACAIFCALALALACSDSEEPTPVPQKPAAQKPVVRTTPPKPVAKPAPKSVKEQLQSFVELPAAYPDDAPAYPGVQPHTAGFQSGRMTASFSTPDSVDKVKAFVNESLRSNGWEDVSETEIPDATVIGALKDGRAISVLISWVKEGGRDVSLMVVAVDAK